MIRLTLRSLAAFCWEVLVSIAQAHRLGRCGMTHSCEFEDFSSQILEDCSNVYGCLGTNAHFVLGVVLEETLDTTAGELENRMLACFAKSEPCRE